MAQGSVAPEGKYGGFSSGSKLEEKVIGALVGISLIGSLVGGYIGIKHNYLPHEIYTNEVYNVFTIKTNLQIVGEVQGYYPGK